MTDRDVLTDQRLSDAYRNWTSTGVLTNDREIVESLFWKFKEIADNAWAIDEYRLMGLHANKEMLALRDIIKSRYGVDLLESVC